MITDRLGNHASLIRGLTYKPNDRCHYLDDGAVACMRTKNVQVALDESDIIGIPSTLVKSRTKFLQEGDILVSSANSWNLVGKCCWVPKLDYTATAGGFISILRAETNDLDRRYLYHWFSSPRIQHLLRSFGNQTTNISNLDHKRCLNLDIPLPPLPEQKRIAKILDAADALRAKRRESLAQLDALLQSTFLEMFGDPVANPKGWRMVTLGDVVERLDGGKNVAQSETPTKYRILKVSAVTSGEYRPDESKFLPSDIDVPDSHLVKAGDLLISRANTSELVGATAYVWQTPENIVLPDKVWKFIWKSGTKIEPLFVYFVSHTKEFRRLLGTRASGTSGSMKNIAKPKLLGLPIPKPPHDLQIRFTATVQCVEQQKSRLRAHLDELEILFVSLQRHAFSGELQHLIKHPDN